MYEELYTEIIDICGIRIILFNNIYKIEYPIYPWNKKWLIYNGILHT